MYNTIEAAAHLGLRPSTLEAWRVRGGGPRYIQMGRAIRYRVSDLEAFAAARVRRSTSDPGNGDAV